MASTQKSFLTRAVTASEGKHPFKIYLFKSGNTYQASVELESNLYKSVKYNDIVTIIGLNTLFNVNKDCKIWLELQFNSGALVSANINNDNEDEWAVFPTPFEYDSGNKIVKSYILLGTIKADEAGDLYVEQIVKTNMILKIINYYNKLGVYAYPYF